MPEVPARPALEWYLMNVPQPDPGVGGTRCFLIYDPAKEPRFVAAAFRSDKDRLGGWRTTDGQDDWLPTHWTFIPDDPKFGSVERAIRAQDGARVER